MKRMALLTTTLIVTALTLAPTATADVPQMINYQGRLTDSAGYPLDTTVSMTFTIYDDSTAGESKWSEPHGSVDVTIGLFNVILGGTEPIDDTVFNGPNRFLGVTVGIGPELTPRTRLISVGYSHRVSTVDGASGGTISGDVSIQSDLDVDGDLRVTGKARLGSGCTNIGSFAFVAGAANQATGNNSSVSGGAYNVANGDKSAIGGGTENHADGESATIGGGRFDTANGQFSTVSGGRQNTASGDYSTVGGGNNNTADTLYYNTVSGGWNNVASGEASVVCGGGYNSVRGNYSVICGGGGQFAEDSNYVLAQFSFLGGGRSNIIPGTGAYMTLGGGRDNEAGGSFSAVGGGQDNVTTGQWSTIPGGGANTASGDYSAVGGGLGNTASGVFATVPGGHANTASGYGSFAAGQGAKANHWGSVVIAATDGQFDSVQSGGIKQMVLRADGGIHMTINGGLVPYDPVNIITTQGGAYLSGTGTNWTNASDQNQKDNFTEIDAHELLEKIAVLPIMRWNYKDEESSVQHIGPTAQDFYALFGVGRDDKTISTVDPAGIALAAIGELHRKTQKIDELESQLSQLQALVETLLAQQDGSNESKAEFGMNK